MTKLALGRGLSALIPDVKANEPVSENISGVNELEVNKIVKNKYQPRLSFDDEAQKELISSIKEKGLIQPIIVRKMENGYELIAGERRFRAAKALGMQKVPAIIKDVSDEESLELSLIENIQRENLNPIDEAKAYKRLATEFNMSQDNISAKVGKERATVANSMRLLNLPDDIQGKLSIGEISVGHAKVLLGLENQAEQRKLVEKIIKDGLSVRETEKAVAEIKEPPVHKRKMAFKDTQIIALEEHMQRVLGTQVKICQGKKKGKIEINYYSQEDLERLLEFFGVDGNQ
jgi:ParB family chromosome partitioning protein